MENDAIIEALELTGKLMELHNENPFKIKAYSTAAFKLSKLRYDFAGKSKEDIEAIEGIGKGISSKIFELITKESTEELEGLLKKTPDGVIEIMGVKGLGPKKVRQLWLELQIESIGELLYACNENRLVTLKGFGEKTQLQVKNNIEFKLLNTNKFHYAALEGPLIALVEAITTLQPKLPIAIVGEMARKCEVIERIDILIGGDLTSDVTAMEMRLPLNVNYLFCSSSEFMYKQLELSSTSDHLHKIGFATVKGKEFNSVQKIYEALSLPFIEPELREGLSEVEVAKRNALPKLIELNDLKGVLHNHTTYSDGVHSVKEMADYCKELGYTYFGICDHSKSAFYANGLTSERVVQQQAEIDLLNSTDLDFKILKGIESDVLNDGSLDYPDEILQTFDFVVASIHSNLKMSEEKATARLIKAIENPYTSILGHPTGRLLLARKGYPIDHKKVIDACAANGVAMELNAHPYRLDIDWRWIPYCLEKGVKVSINPDAHHKEGFKDMYFGVCVARKGMLDKDNCLNALSLPELMHAFKK
ncbi:MAG: PHP domain-containing protein [bacterium]|nr:PHP domain-containing protein [bacterium]